jgi:ankyrin repeat protein
MQATNLDAVAVLLGHGANVNDFNGEGMTCLMLAAENGLTDTVNFLVESGADLYAHDYDGLTSMDHARESGAPRNSGASGNLNRTGTWRPRRVKHET